MSINFNAEGGGSPEPKERKPAPTLSIVEMAEKFANKWLCHEIRQWAKDDAWYDRFIRGKWDPELVEISEIGPQRFQEETCV